MNAEQVDHFLKSLIDDVCIHSGDVEKDFGNKPGVFVINDRHIDDVGLPPVSTDFTFGGRVLT